MWSWQTQIWSYSPAWGPARGMQRFSHEIVSDSFVTPWTVAFQAPLSVGFLQERMQVWVAVSFSRGLPDPRIEPVSSALAGRFLTTEPPGKPGECRGCEKNIPSSGQCSGISDWCFMTHGWEEFSGETPTLSPPWDTQSLTATEQVLSRTAISWSGADNPLLFPSWALPPHHHTHTKLK